MKNADDLADALLSTKREKFAMAAMQGILSHEYGCNQQNGVIAERAIDLADALLSKLSEGEL